MQYSRCIPTVPFESSLSAITVKLRLSVGCELTPFERIFVFFTSVAACDARQHDLIGDGEDRTADSIAHATLQIVQHRACIASRR